jgi:hypothetical protein
MEIAFPSAPQTINPMSQFLTSRNRYPIGTQNSTSSRRSRLSSVRK